VKIFGHAAGCEASDRVERTAADDPATAAEERSIPEILALLDDLEEERLLGPDCLGRGAPMLKRIEVEEVLRRLDECHARIAEETQRAVQKVFAGRVIGVEDGDELSLAVCQRVIEVTGLRIDVRAPRKIAASDGRGEFLHLRP
jgi:hypothetical protein